MGIKTCKKEKSFLLLFILFTVLSYLMLLYYHYYLESALVRATTLLFILVSTKASISNSIRWYSFIGGLLILTSHNCWISSYFWMQLIIFFMGGWSTIMPKVARRQSLLLQLAFTSFVLLSSVNSRNAGITSTFIRSEWPSIDIPLDNEAFAVPKGHNAPQQVSIHSY